jgi:NAD(P)-dependent dehydrogenase (short-subunit alcohol dehydrogenase family)
MTTTARHGGAFSATLAGVLDRLRGGGSALVPDARLDGQTVLVTGASRGLGRAIATGLGALGAHVIVPVRTLGAETVAAIEEAGGRATAMSLDLLSLASVDALVHHLAADGVRLDRLVLNAGMVPKASRLSGDGFDAMLQVNFLSNTRLVAGLLESGVLRPSTPAPRIIVVGSESHRSAPAVDPDTITTPRTYGTGEVVAEYGRTKLLLHTWTVELARRLDTPGDHVAVHHLCPGAVNSDIAREAPGWAMPLLKLSFKLFFQSPEAAARPVIYLTAATDPGARTGVYLHMNTRRDPAPLALDPARGAALWSAVEAIHAARP